jgi:hypothetical protein
MGAGKRCHSVARDLDEIHMLTIRNYSTKKPRYMGMQPTFLQLSSSI